MGTQLPIAEAGTKELAAFARDNLGMNLPGNMLRENMLARIGAAWDKDYITIPDYLSGEPEHMAGQAPKPVTAAQALPAKGKVRIEMSVTEDAGGNEAVPVGVNGKIMLIPRGKPVDILRSYYLVLKNAVAHKYDPLPDGGINPVARKVSLYPFQLIAEGPLSKAELRAEAEATKAAEDAAAAKAEVAEAA